MSPHFGSVKFFSGYIIDGFIVQMLLMHLISPTPQSKGPWKISEQEIFSDSLGEAGSVGDTYPKMLIANTQTIVEGLGGKFTPFQLKKLK